MLKPFWKQPVEQLSQTGREARRAPRLRWLVELIVLLLILLGIALFLRTRVQTSVRYMDTDDSYVTGHSHIVSSRVEGVVEEVLVDDNDQVKRGQTAIRLDPHDYKVALDLADAKVAASQKKIKQAIEVIRLDEDRAKAQQLKADGMLAAAGAEIELNKHAVLASQHALAATSDQVEQEHAQLVRAKLDYDRYMALALKGVVSEQQCENAVRDYDLYVNSKKAAEKHVLEAEQKLNQSRDAVRSAQASLVQAQGEEEKAESERAQIDVAKRELEVAVAIEKQAAADKANSQLQLNYCDIYAPTAGRIGKRTVEVGHRINPGEQLLTVIEGYAWVVSNYKETQVKHMRSGQTVSITIDGISNKVFNGVVDSFSPGSGSTFSLIPPDNATGNFTKIVQRIPVKIRFTPDSIKGFENRIVVGMSCVTSVDLQSSPNKDLNNLRQIDDPLRKLMPYHW